MPFISIFGYIVYRVLSFNSVLSQKSYSKFLSLGHTLWLLVNQIFLSLPKFSGAKSLRLSFGMSQTMIKQTLPLYYSVSLTLGVQRILEYLGSG